MPLDEILTLLRARPFVPFLIHVLDGTSYEIRHPELILPMSRSILIGLNPDPALPYAESGRVVTVALLSISRLEPRPETAVGQN